MSSFRFTLPNLIQGTNGSDTINGTDGDDAIYGLNGDDRIYGGIGHDLLSGGAGNDRMWGGWGNDTLVGDDGDDHLHGEWGDDRLDGGAGNDTMHGGHGNDVFIPGTGNDVIYGDADYDIVDYSTLAQGVTVAFNVQVEGAGTVTGRGGLVKSDTFAGIEKVIGSQGNDYFVLARTSEADGGKGDDFFQSGTGANVINGGAGVDTVSYLGRNTGIEVDLSRNTAGDGDRLTGVENVIGTAHADVLIGDSQANVLRGGAGNDELRGGAGNDRLHAGTGRDLVWGGADADRFVFESVADSPSFHWYSSGTDQRTTIMDFNRAEGDKIELSGMGGFIFSGNLQYRDSNRGDYHMLAREIGFSRTGDVTTVWINTDGDMASEMQIQVRGMGDAQLGDFIFT